jgi:hypothetical protein
MRIRFSMTASKYYQHWQNRNNSLKQYYANSFLTYVFYILKRSIGLWRRYVNKTIIILDTINRPIFYLKHNVSEIGFSSRLRVELTQLSPTNRVSLCLHPELYIYIYRAQMSMFHLKTGTKSSLRNAVF